MAYDMVAHFRFGLTATPDRADGLTPMLAFALGEPVFRVERAHLVAADHLVVPGIVAVETGITGRSGSHSDLVAEFVRHESRNARLLRFVTAFTVHRHATLVHSARVDHCEHLAARLCEGDVTAAALTSRRPKAQRTAILDALRSGELSVVCAASLTGEGLEVSRLERLVLATTVEEGAAYGNACRPTHASGVTTRSGEQVLKGRRRDEETAPDALHAPRGARADATRRARAA